MKWTQLGFVSISLMFSFSPMMNFPLYKWSEQKVMCNGKDHNDRVTFTFTDDFFSLLFMFLLLLLHINSSFIFVTHSFYIYHSNCWSKCQFHLSQNAFRITLPIWFRRRHEKFRISFSNCFHSNSSLNCELNEIEVILVEKQPKWI